MTTTSRAPSFFAHAAADARALRHEAEARGVGVIAIELSVRAAHERVDAADGLRHRVEHIAVRHHVALVGNGDVQPADVLPREERAQLLRLQLDETIVRAAERGVNGRRPAVTELSAQKSVNLLPHRSHLGVVSEEYKLRAAALHFLKHGKHARVLHACLQLKEEHKLKIAPRHGAGFELGHVDVQRRELGEDLIERAGLILEREDKADAVRTGVDDGVLRHAEKAGVIILAVLNFVAHTFKAVKRGAGM